MKNKVTLLLGLFLPVLASPLFAQGAAAAGKGDVAFLGLALGATYSPSALVSNCNMKPVA